MLKDLFVHDANEFNPTNMAVLATMANLAYQNKPTIEQILQTFGYNTAAQDVFFENKLRDTQGFIVGDDKKIIISFRGSEAKWADWKTNFSVEKEPWAKLNKIGAVHEGFADAIYAIWPTLEQRIAALRTNNQSIWFTGHSLGGALAVLAAALLQLEPEILPCAGVYTYGQPRAGDNTFAKNYNQLLKSRTFRFVNQNDIVSRVPPQIMGYSHVGWLRIFDQQGKLHEDRDLSRWASFWDRLQGRAEDVMEFVGGVLRLNIDATPDGVDDHSIDKYEWLAYRAAGLPNINIHEWQKLPAAEPETADLLH